MFAVNSNTGEGWDAPGPKKPTVPNLTGKRGMYVQKVWAIVYFDGVEEQIVATAFTEQEIEKKAREIPLTKNQ
jgi:hypothetical protein